MTNRHTFGSAPALRGGALSRAVLVGFAVVVLSNPAAPAAARRASAVSGEPGFGGSGQCFHWDPANGNSGIRLIRGGIATCSGGFVPLSFVIPLQLDTSGAKTVSLTLKMTTLNTVSCGLAEFDLAGNQVELVEYDPFPAGPNYITRQETISVTASNNLVLLCAYNQSDAGVEGARLLSISY